MNYLSARSASLLADTRPRTAASKSKKTPTGSPQPAVLSFSLVGLVAEAADFLTLLDRFGNWF